MPEGGEYLIAWFWDINSGVDRAGDGFCRPITWADYMGWQSMTGEIVHPFEFDILRDIDTAFVSEMTKEIQAARAAAQSQGVRNG
jgi:hypothetical protein